MLPQIPVQAQSHIYSWIFLQLYCPPQTVRKEKIEYVVRETLSVAGSL